MQNTITSPTARHSYDERRRGTLDALAQARNAHDAAPLASLFDEAAVVTVAGAPAPIGGRAAIRAYYQAQFDAFADFEAATIRTFLAHDVAIVEWAWTGTHSGRLGALEPTWKRAGTAAVDVIWFSPDGLVRELHAYYDMATVLAQLGVSQAPARPIPNLPAIARTISSAHPGGDHAKMLDVARTMFGAWASKREDDFVSHLALDHRWVDFTRRDAIVGRSASKKLFADWLAAFPDASSTTTNAWAIGQFVVAEGVFRGTQMGALAGIPATNRPVRVHGLEILRFDDGVIVEGWSYTNALEVLMQLGMVP